MNNRKTISIIICTIFLAFLFQSCIKSSFEITDNYIVKPIGVPIFTGDDFGTKGWHLFCNPGCDYDVKIDNIKTVHWNKRHIVIEQQENEKPNWYLIIAHGEELRCCNRDTIIGPVSKVELDSLIKMKNLNVVKMKKKHFQ
jgi:hypothetical protein